MEEKDLRNRIAEMRREIALRNHFYDNPEYADELDELRRKLIALRQEYAKLKEVQRNNNIERGGRK